MFIAHATEMAANPAFRLKLLCLVAAGLNALLFHRGVFSSVSMWNQATAAPTMAKIAALVSLALWLCIITCGRLLAYL
jgi:hypothetical protein